MKYRISSDAITTDFELLREEDKPYSRIAKFGAETLTDEELAMCVIGSGTSKNNVADIAINLISAMRAIKKILQKAKLQETDNKSWRRIQGSMALCFKRTGKHDCCNVKWCTRGN